MSSLPPERSLVFSPSLAATIGLSEAILLQLLADLAALQGGPVTDLRTSQLQHNLPFWSVADLERIAHSLRDKGVISLYSGSLAREGRLRFSLAGAADARLPATAPAPAPGAHRLAPDWQPDDDLLQLLQFNHGIPTAFALDQLEDFRLYWRSRDEAHHAWPSRFRSHVIRRWREHQQQQARGTAPIEAAWLPSEDAMEILLRTGISRAFIEDAVPEFVLYWRERGEAGSTWNSRFIAHVRRQWARYRHSLHHDDEPRPLPPDWQPSEDVFDILRLANIDADFAREQLAEFSLFWRDVGTPQRSWNSKFLQHIKYQWAHRHHMRLHHAGTDPTDQRSTAFQRLTDRSWAAGIVDGV